MEKEIEIYGDALINLYNKKLETLNTIKKSLEDALVGIEETKALLLEIIAKQQDVKQEKKEPTGFFINGPCPHAKDGLHCLQYVDKIVVDGGRVIRHVMLCKKCKKYIRCGGQPRFC